MSKEKKIIEVTPGILTPGGRMIEKLESKGHRCPYCQGNGYFWLEDEFREAYKSSCPVCQGSGTVDALVSIEWRPSGNS